MTCTIAHCLCNTGATRNVCDHSAD